MGIVKIMELEQMGWYLVWRIGTLLPKMEYGVFDLVMSIMDLASRRISRQIRCTKKMTRYERCVSFLIC